MDANMVTDNKLAGLPIQLTDNEGLYSVNNSKFTQIIQARITAEGYRDTLVRLQALEELAVVYLQPIEVIVEVNIDRDGIPDNIDQCPNTPKGLNVDDKGCVIPLPTTAFTPHQMIRIPGGTFTMGCKNEERDGNCYDREKPDHPVTISTFYMGRKEVTNAEFVVFLNKKGNQEEGGIEWVNLEGSYNKEKCRIIKQGGQFVVEEGYENHPIIYVSWYGARALCVWLSEETGQNYHLPTEAQWEYAARGGEQDEKDNFRCSGSNDIDEVAWYSLNSSSRTHKVGGKQPNQLGLYDMSGNVWEWCADRWHEDYKGAPKDGSAGLVTSKNQSYRVLRGGSWDLNSRNSRVAYRNRNNDNNRNNNNGFRVAREYAPHVGARIYVATGCIENATA